MNGGRERERERKITVSFFSLFSITILISGVIVYLILETLEWISRGNRIGLDE